ncbi:hypothetical protein AXF42_Ash004176 [Apostasia shenzhenica]|uniref:FHA domain-containing protein n=1 Tax=Apostasia shenzhenica TaxID=1088818 RepID=A0A2I0A269_9ASPA|nr:hypothetical protein AXF42_Ash004176 [Apostasia shenzhenica]
MASPSGTGSGVGDREVGFAKLQGEDFEYYMQTYSIVLGRNSKRAEVDVDLASIGGGMSVSRHHARIFYDFSRRRFALEVLGKNGCFVEGVLHVPGAAPVKLDSQDLLQIGDKKFYFLLPKRSLFASSAVPWRQVAVPRCQPQRLAYHGVEYLDPRRDDEEVVDREEDVEEENMEDEEEDEQKGKAPAKRVKRAPDVRRPFGKLAKKMMRSLKANREEDDHVLLQLEEKDVLSSVATILSETCGPGEWMPLVKLHAEMVKQYRDTWHHSSVRSYLTSEDWPERETNGKPWFGLLTLLRKHPEHFVVNVKSKGRARTEFVSLASLIS